MRCLAAGAIPIGARYRRSTQSQLGGAGVADFNEVILVLVALRGTWYVSLSLLNSFPTVNSGERPFGSIDIKD